MYVVYLIAGFLLLLIPYKLIVIQRVAKFGSIWLNDYFFMGVSYGSAVAGFICIWVFALKMTRKLNESV